MHWKREGMRAGESLFCPAEWIEIADSLGLTPRESEVVQAALDDMSESEIAGKLEISRHTVHAHIERVYRKLGVSSRVQLVVRIFAVRISLGLDPQCIAPSRRCPLHMGRLNS